MRISILIVRQKQILGENIRATAVHDEKSYGLSRQRKHAATQGNNEIPTIFCFGSGASLEPHVIHKPFRPQSAIPIVADRLITTQLRIPAINSQKTIRKKVSLGPLSIAEEASGMDGKNYE